MQMIKIQIFFFRITMKWKETKLECTMLIDGREKNKKKTTTTTTAYKTKNHISYKRLRSSFKSAGHRRATSAQAVGCSLTQWSRSSSQQTVVGNVFGFRLDEGFVVLSSKQARQKRRPFIGIYMISVWAIKKGRGAEGSTLLLSFNDES